MPDGFYTALWILLNLVTTIYDIFCWCILKAKSLYLRSYDLANRRRGSYEIAFLERCKGELDKIPKHLSVIIGNYDDTGPDVLSRIAFYALVMDIDYISFYDTRNDLTLEKVQVPKYVSSKSIPNGRFVWSMAGDRKTAGHLTYKNGIKKSIEVVALSYKDGKPLFAEVCRDLFEKRKTPEIQEALKDRIKLQSIIHAALQKKLNYLPEPECAMVFSSHLCTYGLLPWHTGFTEFHLVKTGSYFNAQAFASILYKFSKCEQRFGK